jgi:YesN/AraC family two-component response regulator
MTSTSSFSNLRVLLVDDEPFVRRVTIAVLNNLKISAVLEAENGEDAITLLKKNSVDLLITDIQMPKMNGIELIKQIRMGKTAAEHGLRTLVVTSFSYTEVLGSCISLDINGFLVKPITQATASDKIQRALAESTHLRSATEYAEVTSDLDLLADAVKKERKEKEINATVLREKKKETTAPKAQQRKDKGVLVALRKLEPGMILADDIYTDTRQKLLSEGQVLKEGLINRLIELEDVLNSTKISINLENLVD